MIPCSRTQGGDRGVNLQKTTDLGFERDIPAKKKKPGSVMRRGAPAELGVHQNKGKNRGYHPSIEEKDSPCNAHGKAFRGHEKKKNIPKTKGKKSNRIGGGGNARFLSC